jgi:hypothetical protein
MSLYRSIGALGGLVGLSIAAVLFNIPLEGNFLVGNHLGESLALVGIIGLLADINLLPQKYRNNFIALGIIALIAGAVWEVLSFGSLFIQSNFQEIIVEWFLIAPIIIGFIGVPILFISRQVSRERLIFGMDATNSKGLVFVFIFSALYTIAAFWALQNLWILTI